MSRRTLAQLVGRSEEWLRQIEKGQRDLPGLELTVRLADVLRFGGVDDLLGRPQSTRRIIPQKPAPRRIRCGMLCSTIRPWTRTRSTMGLR